MCMFCLYSCFILLNSLSGIEFTSTLKRKKKRKKEEEKKKNPYSILFWFVGFCCHFILKCCFLTFVSTSLFNVIFHLNCLLIVCAALAEHD